MQRRYWLRGTCVAGAIWLILAILVVPGALINGQYSFLPRETLLVVTDFSGFSFVGLGAMALGMSGLLLGLILHLAIYIAVGSLLGWLYGKVKNRSIHNS